MKEKKNTYVPLWVLLDLQIKETDHDDLQR